MVHHKQDFYMVYLELLRRCTGAGLRKVCVAVMWFSANVQCCAPHGLFVQEAADV